MHEFPGLSIYGNGLQFVPPLSNKPLVFRLVNKTNAVPDRVAVSVKAVSLIFSSFNSPTNYSAYPCNRSSWGIQ
jgi:hypothetical protein